MGEWSKWRDINELPDYKGAGVYKIRILNNNNPIVVNRFLACDEEGILQIGRSNNINRRLKYFLGCINGKDYSHAEGKKFHLISEQSKINEIYKDLKLQYSFLQTEEHECESKEEYLIKCYFKKHGEVPPLNNNLPDSLTNWEGLKCR